MDLVSFLHVWLKKTKYNSIKYRLSISEISCAFGCFIVLEMHKNNGMFEE